MVYVIFYTIWLDNSEGIKYKATNIQI